MVYNPHNPSEIWVTDGMFRRHITPTEYDVRTYFGATVVSISAAWFDSLPIATG